jgi:hypothetical protein
MSAPPPSAAADLAAVERPALVLALEDRVIR